MSSFAGQAVFVGPKDVKRAVHKAHAPIYNVVAVHGIGNMGIQNAIWTCSNQDDEATSWLTDLLPIHARCGSIVAFNYSCENFREGISVDDIKALAIQLLDQLLQLLISDTPALSLAVGVRKYDSISGNTSLLVFFGTPQKAQGSKSWESGASWLLHVSGEDNNYDVPWILKTSKMLRAVAHKFASIENIYRVINVFHENPDTPHEMKSNPLERLALDSHSEITRTPGQTNIGRNKAHADIAKFSVDTDEAFVQIYKELRISRGPGIPYAQCLASLANIFSQFGAVEPTFTSHGLADVDSGAIQQLESQESYKSWLKNTRGSLCIQGHLGSDVLRLQTQVKTSDDAIVIYFKCGSKSTPHSGPTQLFASLCHQILCLRARLFDYVSEIYDLYSQNGGWRQSSLRMFFSSLLGCPYEGHVVCLIEDIDEIESYGELLDELVTLANSEVQSQNFKLIVTIRSGGVPAEFLQRPETIISIEPARADLKSIVDSEVSSFLSKRPGLSSISGDLKKMLHSKFEDSPDVLTLSGSFISCIIRVFLMLLFDLADPATKSSMSKSALLIENNMDDIYRQFLAGIHPQHRQLSRNTLSWLARAFRPLKLDELAVVSAFELDGQDPAGLMDEIPIDIAWNIKMVVGDLVQVGDDLTVHLHDCFRDYILRQQLRMPGETEANAEWFAFDSHLVIARKCLEYISLRARQGTIQLPTTTGCCPDLFSYAIRHWADHYRVGNAEVSTGPEPGQHKSPEFDVLFHDATLMNTWARLYFDSQPPGMQCESSHSLCVSMEVGCRDLVAILLEDSGHSQTTLTSALETAIRIGDESIVRKLLDSGATSQYAMHIAATSGKASLFALFHETVDDLLSENLQGLTPLQCACRGGYLPAVDALKKLGSDAKAKSRSTGQNSLHVACQFGNVRVITYLLGIGVDPDDIDKGGFTPLHVACKWQQARSVSSLFSCGETTESMSLVNNDKSTPLHLAVISGRVDVVKLLLKNDIDGHTIRNLISSKDSKGMTPLHLAASGGHSEIVREFMRLEAELVRDALTSEDLQEYIPLHHAAERGCSDVMKQLLECSDVKEEQIQHRASCGMGGAYPIHLAAEGSHVAALELLCEAHREEQVSVDVRYSLWRDWLSPLHLAATNGQIDTVRLLLDNSATVDVTSWDSDTPLKFASNNGHVKIADLLLENGANPDAEDDYGRSPISAAVEKDNATMVDLLLKRSASGSSQNERDLSLLMTATERGYAKIASILLKRLPDLNTKHKGLTPLMVAAENGHAELVKLFLDEGVDPTIRAADGREALHFAAKFGDLKTIQLLLGNRKVEPSKPDSKGCTPLHFAVKTKSLDVVNEFLQRHASATTEDEDGVTPLDLAPTEALAELLLTSTEFEEMDDPSRIVEKALGLSASLGFTELIKKLSKYKADMEKLDPEGRSLYHLAAKGGRTEVIELLLELRISGPDPMSDTNQPVKSVLGSLSQPDKTGKTPLIYAAEYGHSSVVDYLLNRKEFSINVNDADAENRTSLWFAAHKNAAPIVQTLMEHNATPEIADTMAEKTPLHLAAEAGYEEIVDILLACNAEKDERDSNGRTPLFLAAYGGHKKVVSKLIESGATDIPDKSGWRTLHAAYDSPETLEFLLANGHADVHSTTNDKMTALHLATRGEEDSVVLLLRFGANPLQPDSDGITPLHIAAKYCKYDSTFGLLLEKAKGPLNVKDNDGRTVLMTAVENSNTSAVQQLMDTDSPFVTEEVGKEVLDVAMEHSATGVITIILSHIGPGSHVETVDVEQILIWALENHYEDVKQQTMQTLQDSDVKTLAEYAKLFKVASDTDNLPLAEFLRNLGSDSEARDEHGWTLTQLIESYKLPANEADSVLVVDEKHLPPSRWSATYSSKTIVFEGDGLQCQHPSKLQIDGITDIIARSDHPVPSCRKFYFEIVVVQGSQWSLGIGFGYNSLSTTRMPGWDGNTWGFHGDDGGFFHNSGWRLEHQDDWRYGTGDCIGCCIDPVRGEAFFTKNGVLIGPCFTDLRGRLFPMVGFGSGVKLIANFGGEPESKPFNYPDGFNMNYREDANPQIFIES